MVNNIPVNGWPQLKDLEAVQPTLDRLDKIEAWKRTVKEETFTGDDITIENALALPARSLITEINALQDLRGYDKPWAGGAGKNKWPFGDFNGTYSNVPFSLAAGTYTASKTNPDVNCGLRFFYADDTSIAFTFFTSETFTLTADVVKINYSSADATTENFMIESGNTATSFAPYSNICPISGRDSVVVDDVGKNLYNNEFGTSSDSGITYTKNADGTIKATGTASANSYYNMTNVVFPAGTYAFNGCPSGGADNKYKISLFNVTTQQTIGTGDIGSGNTFTANGTDEYRLFIRVNNGYAFPTGGLLFKPMVRLASITDDTYEPYAHSSATLNLGTTVYGADINWDTGVMTVDKVLTVVNNNSAISVIGSGGFPFYVDCLTGAKASTASALSGVLSNYLTEVTQSSSWGTPFTFSRFTANNDRVHFKLSNDITTADAAKTYLASNPIQFCYELATPTTIQLTPAQLEMLKGYNHITLSDGYGTIELKALTGANWS